MAPPKTEAADKPNSIDGLIRAANQAARNRDYSTCAQTLEQLVATDQTTETPATIWDGLTTRVISGHAVLLQAALEAVRQWKYEPTLLDGKPVQVETTVDVIFQLNNLR